MDISEIQIGDTVSFTYQNQNAKDAVTITGVVQSWNSSFNIKVGDMFWTKERISNLELVVRPVTKIYSNVDRDFAQQGDVATFASDGHPSQLLMYDPKTDVLKPWRWLVPPVLKGSVLDDNSYFAYAIRWEENFWGNTDAPRLVVDGTTGKLLV